MADGLGMGGRKHSSCDGSAPGMFLPSMGQTDTCVFHGRRNCIKQPSLCQKIPGSISRAIPPATSGSRTFACAFLRRNCGLKRKGTGGQPGCAGLNRSRGARPPRAAPSPAITPIKFPKTRARIKVCVPGILQPRCVSLKFSSVDEIEPGSAPPRSLRSSPVILIASAPTRAPHTRLDPDGLPVMQTTLERQHAVYSLPAAVASRHGRGNSFWRPPGAVTAERSEESSQHPHVRQDSSLLRMTGLARISCRAAATPALADLPTLRAPRGPGRKLATHVVGRT